MATFLFQVLSSHPTIATDNSGFPQVDFGPGFQNSEIDYAYKFYNSTESSNYTSVISNWDASFGNSSSITGSITSDTVSNVQVLSIFNSGTDAASSEVDAVRNALSQGKGLLYLTNSYNSSNSAQKFFDDLFGVSIINFTSTELYGSTFSGNHSYVLATEFTSPATPLTQNVTKLVFPHTVGMNINYTAIPKTNITIKDIYPIVYDSNKKEDLGVAIEVGDFGRIVILGSSEVFSNDLYSKSGLYSQMYGLSNELFSTNVLQWLGRGSGYFHMFSHSLNVYPLQQINRGLVINGTVQLTDENNNTLKDVEVQYQITNPNLVFDYNYMSYSGNNTYYGSISTKDVQDGLEVEIHVQLFKRGYIDQSFILTRVYVKLEYPGPALPELSILTVLLASIIIYILTAVYVWSEFRKTGL